MSEVADYGGPQVLWRFLILITIFCDFPVKIEFVMWILLHYH